MKKDKALKNLLNLKEDYTLDLDKYKNFENLSFKEAEDEDEVDEDEVADEVDKDEDESKKKEPKKSATKYLEVKGLPEVFDSMKRAESAADVGQSLKKFLTLLKQGSIEALVKTENQNL